MSLHLTLREEERTALEAFVTNKPPFNRDWLWHGFSRGKFCGSRQGVSDVRKPPAVAAWLE